MTGKFTSGLLPSASLGAILVAAALSGAAAQDQAAADPCDTAVVDATQARGIASSYLRDMGYDSRATALTRFGVRGVMCRNGQWRVSVNLSQAQSRAERAVVLVNCHSGAIEERSRGA